MANAKRVLKLNKAERGFVYYTEVIKHAKIRIWSASNTGGAVNELTLKSNSELNLIPDILFQQSWCGLKFGEIDLGNFLGGFVEYPASFDSCKLVD